MEKELGPIGPILDESPESRRIDLVEFCNWLKNQSIVEILRIL